MERKTGVKILAWVGALLAVSAMIAINRVGAARRAAERAAWEEAETARLAKLGISARGTNGLFRTYLPLPRSVPHQPRSATCGMRLFQSRILVGSPQTCGSCHVLRTGGTDGRVHNGKFGGKRTRSVLLSAITCTNLATKCGQMLCAATNDETNGIPARLERDAVLNRAFRESFAGNFALSNVVTALTEYVRTLVPPHTNYDRFLLGRKQALSEQAQTGFGLFQQHACVTCHHGPALGFEEVPALRGLRQRAAFPEAQFKAMRGVSKCDESEVAALRAFLREL